jgi:hypothetical protein
VIKKRTENRATAENGSNCLKKDKLDKKRDGLTYIQGGGVAKN